MNLHATATSWFLWKAVRKTVFKTHSPSATLLSILLSRICSESLQLQLQITWYPKTHSIRNTVSLFYSALWKRSPIPCLNPLKVIRLLMSKNFVWKLCVRILITSQMRLHRWILRLIQWLQSLKTRSLCSVPFPVLTAILPLPSFPKSATICLNSVPQSVCAVGRD